VFGAVSSTVASLAAVEAIKVISGIGEPLTGKLLTIDLRDMRFHQYALARNPHCPVCAGKK
jgi:bacteriocin biosynthesis cyclodehydratase domain-containing protein